MTFLDFEKPIADISAEMDKLREVEAKTKVSMSDKLAVLEAKKITAQQDIYAKLTIWQRIQVSRHPERPYTLRYIELMTSDFVELHGDRCFRDDKAIVGGFCSLNGQTVMVIGHQKGSNTKMRQYRNFGMPNPEGYRKALRLMKLAEKFQKPVITLIDTPGAFPGEEAEQRGQGEAIARNLFEMVNLKVPVICVVIGEGASGGALGIGVGDRMLMMENTWYSVISPESCSSILWRSWDKKELAAEALKPTPNFLLELGLIDEIIPEPVGGAHANHEAAAEMLKTHLCRHIAELQLLTPTERIQRRIARYDAMGVFNA